MPLSSIMTDIYNVQAVPLTRTPAAVSSCSFQRGKAAWDRGAQGGTGGHREVQKGTGEHTGGGVEGLL